MNDLTIGDRVYLFEKFNEMEVFFQDKINFSMNLKNRKRNFSFRLFDETVDECTRAEIQILRVYINDQATNMYIKVFYQMKNGKEDRRVRLVSLNIKQRIILENEYREIVV